VIGALPAFTRLGFSRSRRFRQPVTARLEGRTAVVTGASSGIGLAAARGLAGLGARVVLVGRDRAKLEAVRESISAETGSREFAIQVADLGILSQVRRAAEAILESEPRIHILVNNAGALYTTRQETPEGFERTFATDLLGPFALTELLLPALSASAPSRVITVSSGGMYTQGIKPGDLQFRQEPYNGPKAYARAKRGLVILTETWARRFQESGVFFHAMHPGWVMTPGIRNSLPGFSRLTRPLLRTPEQGADTIVWLAVAPEAALVNGLFWLDRSPRTTHVSASTRETPEQRQALDQALRAITFQEKT
jgi:NAD(P)-dependent dehydrogenase (short-subunit alcohol dehydrogenase family)